MGIDSINTNSSSWIFILVISVIFASTHPILINLGKVDGNITFSSVSVALMVELTKLIISAIFFANETILSTEQTKFPNTKNIFLYAVPAVLYAITNNLITHAQNYMDPASFQVLNNLKIAATAILYKIFINKHLSKKKWIAVAILFLAGVIHSVGGLKSTKGKQDKEMYITITGIYVVVVYCLISGIAGVYTEAVLKKYKSTSIHLQNVILYLFGMMVNSFMYIAFNFSPHQYVNFFNGFTLWTWSIVFSQAINGIIVSMVMKHASNITRLFMIGSSILMTSVFSYVIFGYQLNFLFFISSIMTLVALNLYK